MHDHEMAPKSEYLHRLSPYHLAVYHVQYYCIGLKKDDWRIWHYRVDLMSDVEILTDDNREAVHIDVCPFERLPPTATRIGIWRSTWRGISTWHMMGRGRYGSR